MKMKNGLLQRLTAALVALALLMGMCAAAQAEDAVITAREMMALLDGFVADNGAEHLAEWQAMFPAARASDAQLTRADGICMLYGAACTARPDKVELGDNWWPLHEKIGEKIWDEYPVNEALFGETVYEPSPWHEWNYSASAYFFALDVRDWDGEMLFDYDPEANTLHTDAPLTRADAETAIARLTSRWSPLEGSMTAREMMARLDQFVEAAAPEKLGEWQAMFPAARESDEMLTRADGICMLYGAACTACPDRVMLGNNWLLLHEKIGEKVWDEYVINKALFGETVYEPSPWHEWDYNGSALFFALDFHDWRGELLFEYDEEANSLHLDQPLMDEDAERAINVLENELIPNYVDITDEEAVRITLSEERLRQAAATNITSIDQLPRLTGFVLTSMHYEGRKLLTTPAQLEEIAGWGFTSNRIMVSYETFFTEDVSQVNLTELFKLDTLVDEAIRSGQHLNLLLMSLPGRTSWINQDYQVRGDFDMFINPQKMELAKKIWQLLAERYKDVPGAYLSFTPFWEALNRNLSTGLEEPNYSANDVTNGLNTLASAIWEKDEDRFIIYEITANNIASEIIRDCKTAYKMMEKAGNSQISFNFCEMPYVYSEMTDTAGAHIDHYNHSMFKPEYPVKIYAARANIYADHPIVMDGFLPAGTTVELYLAKSGRGTFKISDGKNTLYREKLSETEYETSSHLSGHYPYATSDKKISFVLDKDTEKLTFSTTGWLDWAGMDVILPEEYAVERWYSYTGYDAYMDGDESKAGASLQKTSRVMICPNSWEKGSHITIHEDVSYTSEAIAAQSTAKTINLWGRRIHDTFPEALIRFECAYFNAGTSSASALRYYDDMLTMFDQYDYDWYSNDYEMMTYGTAFGATTVQYGDYANFDLPLLQLLQKHQ